MARKRITIAILALGGQGGGVLADWILELGSHGGYRTQGTSVPGVAQRTGTTVYYIEMVPDEGGSEPVLALTPVPGDVDIVVASELMESGRAIQRGFVTSDRTILIGSTHRVYAISEKTAMGDGLADGEPIVEKARGHAKRFIGFDMDEAAAQSGSVISSVMLGALAGSGALPFPREAFEQAVRASGIAVESNLRGFEAGLRGAEGGVSLPHTDRQDRPTPTTAAGRGLEARVLAEVAGGAQIFALHGVRRLMDYQDAAYAGLYLDRLRTVAQADDGSGDHALTAETARYLALWMSYEDTIRVADLKTRASRVSRVREEVRVTPDQLITVTEFMHPRLREVCETLPAGIGRRILASRSLTGLLAPRFTSGRHVETTSIRWFMMLRAIAGLRRWRRGTLRYHEEQQRIEAWLQLVLQTARGDVPAAIELARCQRLVKGYGDTFERGLRNFGLVTDAYRRMRGGGKGAPFLADAREAALKDEDGKALAEFLINSAAGHSALQ